MSVVSDSGDEREFRSSISAMEEALIGNGKVKKSIFKRKSKKVHVDFATCFVVFVIMVVGKFV